MPKPKSTVCPSGHDKPLDGACVDCIRLRNAANYAKNRDKQLVKQKEYYEAHRDAISAQKAVYRSEHRDDALARSTAWRIANQERANEQSRAAYARDPAKAHAYTTRWRDENRARVNELARERYAKNPKKFVAKSTQWKKDNPERNKEHFRKHYVLNAAEFVARAKAWKLANAELHRELNNHANNRRRARIAGSIGGHTRAEWHVILDKQKNKCAYCGFAGKLEKDHRIPVSLGGSDMAVNLQGLCKPCNGSKSAKIAEGTQLGIFDRITKAV